MAARAPAFPVPLAFPRVARASGATSVRERLLSLPSDPIFRMHERARLDALLRLRAVVLLHVIAHPRVDFGRHLDAVDEMSAIEPAPGFFGAHRDLHRQPLLALHAPEDEHAWLEPNHVQVVTLGFVAMQL